MMGEGHLHNANPGNSGMYVVATMIIELVKLVVHEMMVVEVIKVFDKTSC